MSFQQGSIILGVGEGKTISVFGDLYTYKAVKEETGASQSIGDYFSAGFEQFFEELTFRSVMLSGAKHLWSTIVKTLRCAQGDR